MLVDPRQRDDPPGVNDGGVESRFDALVEEHRVQHVARGGVQAERDIRQSEDRRRRREARPLSRLIPSMVSMPSRLLSSIPVESGRASGRIEGPRARGRSVPTARSWIACAARASIRPSSPGPLCRCTCRRPLRRAPGRAIKKVSSRVPGSSPSSRLTEFMIGRPPSHSRAVRTTGASVESTIRGVVAKVAIPARDLLHVGDAVGARVVDAHVEDVGAFFHLVDSHRNGRVPVALEHRLAKALEPFALVRSPDDEERRVLVEVHRRIDRRRSRLVLGMPLRRDESPCTVRRRPPGARGSSRSTLRRRSRRTRVMNRSRWSASCSGVRS